METQDEQPGARDDQSVAPAPRRPRQVEGDARYLQKEARRILKRHGARIAASAVEEIQAAVAGIDTARARTDHVAMDGECERLDSLLQDHAAFARKSALRETMESVGFALCLALGVRTCVYEPFKIPSGSMIPTLQVGDHIFVNKFVYGVQVPGMNQVVAEDAITPIQRGDVVVFRYPLDPAEGDYIKRVIGIGGDTVRVQGREIWIRPRGAARFEPVAQKSAGGACLDEDGVTEISACERIEETLGDHTYVVRYMNYAGLQDAPIAPKPQTYEVPEGHLFVMGDNRDQSKDSRLWRKPTEAVSADRVLSQQDLRDLGGSEATFIMSRPSSGAQDTNVDEVAYHGRTRAPGYDFRLDVWRTPPLGSDAMFRALQRLMPDAASTTVGELVRNGTDLVGQAKAATLETGAEIDALFVGGDAKTWVAAFYLQPADTVMRIQCGRRSCTTSAQLAEKIANTVREFNQDHSQAAKELVQLDRRATFQADWVERDSVPARYYRTRFESPAYNKAPDGRDVVELMAWRGRGTGQGKALLRDAALIRAGRPRASADSLPDLGEDAWLAEGPGKYTIVQVLESSGMVVALTCGKQQCPDRAAAVALAAKVRDRTAEAARDRRRLPDLLTEADVPSWRLDGASQPAQMAWDSANYRASARGPEHAFRIKVTRAPSIGLSAALAQVQAKLVDAVPESNLGVPAWRDAAGETLGFAVDSADTVVEIQCGPGICPDVTALRAFGQRALDKARDPSNFVDPNAWRPKPFVPRGNVKGRADRIWWPAGRFWVPVD